MGRTLRNELTWSRSRAKIFEECRRKYWFRYYGHWGGWEGNADERTRALYVLGKLQTRWMWAGDLVHRAIAETLEVLRAGGKREAEGTAERAVEQMRREFDHSRKKKYRSNPKGTGLLEHEYDMDLPDERWVEVADHVRACVKQFFASPFREKLANLDGRDRLPVEQLDSFDLDGVKVWVKPDCAYREGSGVVLLDWKTGRRDEEDPVQLAGYAIYALNKGWASAPGEVRTVEYNLALDRVREETMTAARIDETRAFIEASLAEMRPFHLQPESEFPVTDDPNRCRECPFRKVCPESPLK